MKILEYSSPQMELVTTYQKGHVHLIASSDYHLCSEPLKLANVRFCIALAADHSLQELLLQLMPSMQVRTPRDLEKADRLIFPGVGACGQCLEALKAQVPGFIFGHMCAPPLSEHILTCRLRQLSLLPRNLCRWV